MSFPDSLNVRSVVLLEADRLHAEALRQYVLRAFARARVRVCASVTAAHAALRRENVHVLVTGIAATIPGDVLELLRRRTNSRRHAPRVLVVTAHCEYRVLAGLRALSIDGVFDCINENPERLVHALQEVAAGARYWSSTLMDHFPAKGACANSLFRALTAFELVVLCVIGDGCDDAVASDALGLSPATVATVRRELHRKLRVQHRGELVRLAAQHGFVRFTPGGVTRPGFAQFVAAYNARKPKRALRPVPTTADRVHEATGGDCDADGFREVA